eukprot:TRINITY_DN3623_c0_g1_i1.p1 TRINITY_DN3623_c0_g1~~TRINITY_DN3623_c0_g1_i1.p1  ORF type:complete len:109 (-),score=9.69 TRINITY_DN3623_c0_g1_i1:97-423(-)
MPSLCQAALIWICMIVAPQAMHLRLRQHSYPSMDAVREIPTPKRPDPDWARIKIPFMLTGSHYKTGTVVMTQLDTAIASALAKRDPAGNATPYVSKHGYAYECPTRST